VREGAGEIDELALAAESVEPRSLTLAATPREGFDEIARPIRKWRSRRFVAVDVGVPRRTLDSMVPVKRKGS